MEHIDCGACCAKMPARAPNQVVWGLIVGFWLISVAVGFAAAQGPGWTIALVSSWIAAASSLVLFARRATSWTCAECGSAVAPPVHALARAVHARHA